MTTAVDVQMKVVIRKVAQAFPFAKDQGVPKTQGFLFQNAASPGKPSRFVWDQRRPELCDFSC